MRWTLLSMQSCCSAFEQKSMYNMFYQWTCYSDKLHLSRQSTSLYHHLEWKCQGTFSVFWILRWVWETARSSWMRGVQSQGSSDVWRERYGRVLGTRGTNRRRKGQRQRFFANGRKLTDVILISNKLLRGNKYAESSGEGMWQLWF